MTNSIPRALASYQEALNRINRSSASVAEKPQATTETSPFQNMVKDAVAETHKVVKTGENMSIQGLSGKADIQDVVLAVANAEQALDTLVSVRNTAISSYQMIMSMNI